MESRGVQYAVAAATLFGLSTPAAKLLLDDFSPLMLSALLYLGATTALHASRLDSREAPLSRADLPLIAGITFFGGTLGPVLMLFGLKHLSAVAGSLLLNLEAPFTALIAIGLLHEHLGRREALAAASIMPGAALVGFQPAQAHADILGAIEIGAACLCWGIDNNLTQRISLRDPIAVARIKTLAAGMCLLVLALWTECQTAGIRVIMITGDYPGTAMSIARQIGLESADVAITGPEVAAMDDQTLRDRVTRASVFARAVPEQKLQLVNALKANGEIVAMTGDGVNDSPALKAAHIGIAMGERGTDVAREAADLVLLDDDFSSIVQAVRLGRRIFDNLKKAMAYIFAIHVPIAGLSLCAVLFRWPFILEPVHVAFLELIIDPACSIVFEAEEEEADIMQRPPRSSTEHLFNRQMVTMSLLQGLASWLFCWRSLRSHFTGDTARQMLVL